MEPKAPVASPAGSDRSARAGLGRDDPDDAAIGAALRAGVVYFGIAFAAGFALGAFRELVIVPRLGRTAGVLLEAPIMLTVAFLGVRWVVGWLAVPSRPAPRLAMGASAFALLMVAEAGLGLALGRTLSEHFAAYRTSAGLIGLGAQIAFALLPLVVAMRSGPAARGGGSALLA